MGIIRWLKNIGRQRAGSPPAARQLEVPSELKLARLLRAVREYPNRTESDLARIIYGRENPALVADEIRSLETAGLVVRDPATGRLHGV